MKTKPDEEEKAYNKVKFSSVEQLSGRERIFAVICLTLLSASCSIIDASSQDRQKQLFSICDKNRDGTLELREIPPQFSRLKQSFGHVDANHDGKLSSAELNRLSSAGRRQPNTSQTMRQSSVTQPKNAAIRVDTSGQGIDPEFLASGPFMSYQDESGNIWLAHINKTTGLPESATMLDSGATKLTMTFNGPEFGIDKNGWSVYYTKELDGVPQIWTARVIDGKPAAQPLFRDGHRRQSVLVSKNQTAESTFLIYVKGDARTGYFHWCDTANPAKEHPIVSVKGLDSPRWIDGTFCFVYAETDGPDAGQLKMHDAVKGKTEKVSSDRGVKSFAYGWSAPDRNGDLMVVAMVDARQLAVFRRTAKSWQRAASIHPPQESNHEIFGSPEPFILNNQSCISAVLKSQHSARFSDSEVWIFGLGDRPEAQWAKRMDDGQPQTMRSDPETLTTDATGFVYYNTFDRSKGYQIYCAPLKASYKSNQHAAVNIYRSVEGPFPSKKQILSFYDRKRNRVVRTTAYFPTVKGRKKIFPLVLFSPGLGGSHEDYTYLGNGWSRAGYIVLVFDHPGSNKEMFRKEGRAGLQRNVLNRNNVELRAGDVSFVLDELESGSPTAKSITNLTDLSRVAMAGHSYGAFTAMALSGLSFQRSGISKEPLSDTRIRATIAMGTQGREDRFFGIDARSWDNIRIPIMTMTGTRDTGSSGQDYKWRLDPFKFMPAGDKYSVVIKGAGHNSFYDQEPLIPEGKPQRDQRHYTWIESTSVAFLDAYLKKNQAGRTWLSGNTPSDLTNGEMSIDRK